MKGLLRPSLSAKELITFPSVSSDLLMHTPSWKQSNYSYAYILYLNIGCCSTTSWWSRRLRRLSVVYNSHAILLYWTFLIYQFSDINSFSYLVIYVYIFLSILQQKPAGKVWYLSWKVSCWKCTKNDHEELMNISIQPRKCDKRTPHTSAPWVCLRERARHQPSHCQPSPPGWWCSLCCSPTPHPPHPRSVVRYGNGWFRTLTKADTGECCVLVGE